MRAELLCHPLRMADHHHEQIVKIVRDAGRQPPECLHLLRLPQALLVLLAFRHIHDRFNHVSPSVRRRGLGPMDQETAAIGHVHLLGHHASPRQRLRHAAKLTGSRLPRDFRMTSGAGHVTE